MAISIPDVPHVNATSRRRESGTIGTWAGALPPDSGSNPQFVLISLAITGRYS